MSDPFNRLTPAEVERLSMLAEEAAEVIRAVGKILRHGYFNCHPDTGVTNHIMLAHEITDFQAVAAAMERAGDVYPPDDLRKRWARKLRYTHHQDGES